MPKRRIFFLFFILIAVGGLAYLYQYSHLSFTIPNSASVTAYAGNSATSLPVTGLSSNSGSATTTVKTRVLIVPGHEPDNGGTQMATPSGEIYERDLAVEIGQDLEAFLQADPNYEAYITRDTQSWNPTFADYFKNDWNDIIAWEQGAKQKALQNPALASAIGQAEVHNSAITDDAYRIYGITKWANENNINLMINVCVNNYRGNAFNAVGKYSGFVEYMPPEEYDNGSTTAPIAEAVFKRLTLYNPVSNLPVESAGLVKDPTLIGIGAYNTAKAAAILIEYDYIYEPQFVNPVTRSLALKDLAYQTYLGFQDFFTKNNTVSVTDSYHPSTLYAWSTPVTGKNSNAEDIYALQTALLMDGDYPPAGKTKNDCPHSGTLGACTEAALRAFQNKNGITGEGVGGAKTFGLLNKIYNE